MRAAPTPAQDFPDAGVPADLLRREVEDRANLVIYRGTAASAVANLVLALLLVAGHDAALRSAWVWGWLLGLSAVYLVRVVVFRRFLRLSEAEQRREPRRWRRQAIFFATLGGVVWAPGLALLWFLSEPPDRFLIVMVVGGMLPSATASLSAIPPALLGYMLPIWLASAGSMAVSAEKPSHLVAAVGSVALLPLLRRAARTMHDEFEEATRRALEQRRLLARLAQARDEALAAARARSEFLAVMSHELRTPLNGVVGATRLLAEEPLLPAQRELAADALSSAQLLLEQVDGVLDLARIDAGSLELDPVDFDLRAELELVRRVFHLRAREKGVRLALEVDPALPGWLRGDWFRVRQVLVNLVGNALKFTEAGAVHLRVRAVAGAPGPASPVRFEVEDTGIGLSPAQQARLFLPFSQAEASTSRRFGGSGLGLTISRRLVALLGGELTLESEPGRGTTFRFEVPLAPAVGQASGLAPAVPLARGLRVLVCDDNEINLKVAARLLERAGHQVALRRDGAEALELLRRATFDAVLMDLQMPVMDGFETLRQVRLPASGALDPRVPMLALTANASVEDRQACLAAGFDAFLTKPIEAAQLMLALDRLCAGPRGQVGEGTRSPAASAPAPPRTP